MRPTACLNVDNQNSAFILTVISFLFSYEGVREANKFAQSNLYTSCESSHCRMCDDCDLTVLLPCSGRD